MSVKLGFWSAAPPSPRQLRSFGLLMTAVGAATAAALWYRGKETAPLWVAGIAAVFLAAALLWPAALRPTRYVWMLFAAILGYVNSHILLALIFYSMFTITGLFMRVFRRDPLRVRGFGRRKGKDGEARTFWRPRQQHLLPADHYKRQF